jgi:hypothetical protein
MISIGFSEEALAYVREMKSPVFIDLPYKVSGCCFGVPECPTVRLGEPGNIADYTRQEMQGATLYVPRCLSGSGALTIRMSSFLGFRGLVIDGWKPI